MRATKTETFLANRPRLRARFEAMASTPGRTIGDVLAAFRAAGADASRSAVARWSKRIRTTPQPESATLTLDVVRVVVGMNEKDLVQLAEQLGILTKAKRNQFLAARAARVGQNQSAAKTRKGVRDGTSNC